MDLNAHAKSARAVCPAPRARKPSEDSTARITLGHRHQAVVSRMKIGESRVSRKDREVWTLAAPSVLGFNSPSPKSKEE